MTTGIALRRIRKTNRFRQNCAGRPRPGLSRSFLSEMSSLRYRSFLATVACVAALFSSERRAPAAVSFSREILPLFSDACFQCHGPDAKTRKGDLRLDEERDVKRDRGGEAAVVRGQSAQSELMRRLLSADPDDVMPPPDANRQLTSAQI